MSKIKRNAIQWNLYWKCKNLLIWLNTDLETMCLPYFCRVFHYHSLKSMFFTQISKPEIRTWWWIFHFQALPIRAWKPIFANQKCLKPENSEPDPALLKKLLIDYSTLIFLQVEAKTSSIYGQFYGHASELSSIFEIGGSSEKSD